MLIRSFSGASSTHIIMLKFLKRIRRKSHTENNVGSFFLYAFGEIFLVVIGILIALKVNNHNEVNKLNDKIIECLLEIHKDLSNDIKESDILKGLTSA